MRCNVGVNPKYLLDQHLIAEYEELPMLIGSLKYWNWEIKSEIPIKFKLGTGHMNFLKIRLAYIKRRHIEIKKEMNIRGFKNDSLTIDLKNIDNKFCNDWKPDWEATIIIRKRIIQRILNFKDITWWRFHRKKMNKRKIDLIIDLNFRGELFYV